MNEKKTQLARIAGILEREGSIDNFRCIHERISLRLGARIWDLRDAGWQIETKKLPDKNTRYVLVSPPPAQQLELAITN